MTLGYFVIGPKNPFEPKKTDCLYQIYRNFNEYLDISMMLAFDLSQKINYPN
jgi:hypothetical protein